MRVSFVLFGNQGVQQIVEKRIKTIEHAFGTEVQSLAIKQLSKSNLMLDYDGSDSGTIKQGLDGWDFDAKFEVQIEFKEVGNDE